MKKGDHYFLLAVRCWPWRALWLLAALWLQPAAAVVHAPSADSRAYRAVVLDNGLQVLLVQDPSADKAAAAIDVKIGSGADPDDRQGLAHLLEHMLFLGTAGYPEAGEYQSFISRHGGSDNAYTAPRHTNYYFDITANYLEPALDRFAQFFTAPLLNTEFVNRERAVVHSEYSSKLQSDWRRIWAARGQALEPAFPDGGFAVGSAATLADRDDDPVREDLLQFFAAYYRAGNMTLAVLGREPLDTLEAWVRTHFAAVPPGPARERPPEPAMYAPGALPLVQRVVPIKELRLAMFVFPVPATLAHYPAKPLTYISHLLGHEEQGSLLALLKSKGWAEGLSVGKGIVGERQSTLEVTITLTAAGLTHYRDIGQLLFAAVSQIREQGLQRWIFDEQAQLARIDFEYQEKTEPAALVRTLAARLHDYPADDVLWAPYRFDHYDETLIRDYLAQLVPGNLHLVLVGPELAVDQTEPNYAGRYALEKLPIEQVSAWQDAGLEAALVLPGPNPFIAVDLDLRMVPGQVPQPSPIAVRDGLRLWFAPDISFAAPRGNFFVTFRSPLANNSLAHSVLTRLYVALVSEQLNAFSYPALLAGLHFELYHHLRGFTLRLQGYTDKQQLLLARIMQAVAQPQITAARFDRVREQLLRVLRNEARQDPSSRTLGDLRRLLLDPAWWPMALINAAEATDRAQLIAFAPRLLAQMNVEALAHGNYHRDEALALASVVAGTMAASLSPVSVPHGQVARLLPGEAGAFASASQHPDTAFALYLQGLDRSLEERAQYLLLGQLLESPFYQDLRTRQQMGYVVFAGAMPVLRVPGLILFVQSPERSVPQIHKAVVRFLEEYARTLDTLPVDVYGQHRQALISHLLAADKQLGDRSARYWREIDQQEFGFDSRQQLAEAIRNVSLASLRDFYRNEVLSEARRALAAYTVPDDIQPAGGTTKLTSFGHWADAQSFRAGRHYFPRGYGD